jgi:hypothetical protein
MFIYILSNITLRQTQIKVKEQLVVRKDMDVNEHERLSNITLRQTQIKVKEHTSCSFTLICVCLSVMLDSLSCKFTFISFLTMRCSFTLICFCLSVMLLK